MTHHNNISHHLLRTALSLVVIFCMALNAVAQTTPPKPEHGTGTPTDPYQIYTLDDLKWIADNAGGRWKSKANGGDGYYVQMAEIDCKGETLKQPIGNKTTAFSGTYDGNGFKIKNINIDWSGSTINDSNVAFGLFGVVSGTIKNVTIDNATVTRTGNNTFKEWSSECSVRMGVLVGSLVNGTAADPAQLKNILILNSTISDNGTDPVAANYFVGGVVGDMSQTYSAFNALTYIKIENIYSDVDIDLSHVTRKTKEVEGNPLRRHQFLVGGVVGRIRNGQERHLPEQTYFTGRINAPRAMIAPCFAGARFSGGDQYGAYYTLVYAGQYSADKCWVDKNDGRYFSDYKIYDPTANSNTGADIVIDSDFITAHSGAGYNYGTHTIKSNYPAGDNTVIDYTKASDMQSFQGVNHGTYIADVSTKYSELSTGTGYEWIETRFGLSMRNEEDKCLEVRQTGTTFAANVKNKTSDFDLEEGQTIKWYIIDENGKEILQIGETAAEANTVDMLLYKGELLKAVLCGADGKKILNHGHQIYGILEATKNIDFGITINPIGGNNEFPVVVTNAPEVSFSIEHQNKKSEKIDEYSANSFSVPLLVIPNKLVFTVSTGEDENKIETTHEINLDYIAKVEGVLSQPQLATVTTHRYNQKGEEITNLSGLTNDLNTTDEFVEGIKSADGTTFTVKDIKTIDRYLIASCTDSKGNILESNPIVIKKVNVKTIQEGYQITATLDEYDASQGSWSWRGISGDIIGTEDEGHDLNNPTNELTIDDHNDKYNVYRVTWTSNDNLSVLHGYISSSLIIYVYNKKTSDMFKSGKYAAAFAAYPDGNDDNDGRTPRTAVKTMARAYQLLKEENKASNNLIVVMGYLADLDFLTQYNPDGIEGDNVEKVPKLAYKKNATITGSYGEITNEGTLMLNGGENTRGLNGATIIKDITLNGLDYNPETNKNETSPGSIILYCNLNDLTIGNNVKVQDYKDMANNNGLIYNEKLRKANAPHITIVGGMHQYSNAPFEYPSGNAVPSQTTLIFHSGNWGRIIASGRSNGLNKTSNNVFGHPDAPHCVEVNVAIKHSKGTDGAYNENDYTPGKNYDYDIGLLVGGQTDGSVYVDAKLYMSDGSVGRFISGNISYGRKTNVGYPSDGFFGSTVLTMVGGKIKELVGGTLGRHNSDAEKCEAYFYGRSILNINGGEIGSIDDGKLTGNIYGAGAGGVVGIGDNDEEGYHTKDQNIPYRTGENDKNGRGTIAYGPYMKEVDGNKVYVAKGKMPKMVLLSGETLDLAKSYCIVNVNGGTINGNIYGGGYGYSKDIPTIRALDQAGNLFGDAYLNINGGVIKGNVYGGGAGSDEFCRMATDSITQAKQYTTVDWETKAKEFEDLANVFGDTHVSISGGIIEGKVFAGSKGIEGFSEMATLYGNTNLTIKNVTESGNTTRIPIINGNIYGGSELGRIVGGTNVKIEGGAIGNCIFGGSEGIATVRNAANEVTTPGTTAYIDGNTKVEISGGTYFTEEHAAKISTANQTAAADRTFNIYGGGYNNCIIDGSTNVTITKSLLSSYKCLLEGRTFENCVNDETYRKFSVYGAGRGELTDVTGDANLTINIVGGASVPSSKPVDVANGQQFFMIAGGGMAGHVWKDTNVTLEGNVFARRIYGGGMYGNVLGDANLTVRRGSYYGVFGGGLLGNVKGRDDAEHAVNLQIGTRIGDELLDKTTATADIARESNRNLYIYNNVYGGNDVSGCAGYEKTTQLWDDGAGRNYEFEHWKELNDGNPYYRHLIRASEEKGVNMKIYGGKILGDVFGAGNGNHTGYYVPNMAESEAHSKQEYLNGTITRMKFYEGLPYHYRVNKNDANSYEDGELRSVLNETVRKDYGLYEYRPRVAKVVMHIGGNSEQDRVEIGGDVYGGGHACTIGRFNPGKDVLKDPSKFEGGGSLEMNFGSHVTVKKSVYMGSRGRIIGQQTVKGEHDYNGITLNSDMDYHYYDATADKYLLGFPNSVEGRNRFHAYMKLVDMDAKTQLTFDEDAEDLRWGSFFAGGARGSMTYNEPDESKPCYEYTLPSGLTVETRVVGGSEDALITYYKYKETEGENAYKEIDYTQPLFTYDGGIVYDSNTGEDGHYGGGVVMWENAPSGTYSDELTVGDETPRGSRTVMKLTVNCQFDPQLATANNADWDDYKNLTDKQGEEESDGSQYWGGLVYGGCYRSGITNGSVEVTCTGSMLGTVDDDFKDYDDYLKASSLRRNVGRVYGGGFGKEANILGNTKVTLDGSFEGFNVFGGGMEGNVTGGTEINVKGNTMVYNAVYGGGMLGSVGKESYTTALDKDLYAKGTNINLYSGGVDRVYGGAFMGDVWGGTHIMANDGGGFTAEQDNDASSRPIRLFAGSIYGGNDVSGTIHKDETKDLSTYINIKETPLKKKQNYYLSHASGTETGKYYGGFPLIGTIYGAGNGDMSDYIQGVTIDRANERFNGGKIHIANGDSADYQVFDLAIKRLPLPSVDKAEIDISGGTIVNVYGGGSMSTTKVSNKVLVNYADTVARAAFLTERQNPMIWGVMRLFEDLQKREVTEQKTVGTTDCTRFSHQIYRVFGGNNLMDMDIQPNLDLKKGYIFSVYSGGNFGRMTYPNGLSLTINSPNIHLSSVYGGGRVGDIDADTDFAADKYGATLNIYAGLIGDVYGGNNVAGNVRNGTNVNIRGAISGNVYGSGNGNYIYVYNDKDADKVNGRAINGDKAMITEGYDEKYGGRYFVLPKKAEFGDSPEDKILAINSYRPNVDKAYLYVEGDENSQVYVRGNVYCGGNSSTVLYNQENPKLSKIKFNIDNYVTLGGVFLGSNGEGLANSNNISWLGNLNGITDWSEAPTKLTGADVNVYSSLDEFKKLYPNLLSLYMRAAEVTALPMGFAPDEFGNKELVDAHIGNFTIGGNRGSMMTDKTITMTLPESLVIFGRVVGGCYNSCVEYEGVEAHGGMIKPLAGTATDKLNLTIKSKFRPWRLLFNEETHAISLVDDRTDENGNYVATPEAGKTYYYSDDRCDIFGGCYTSGKTVGNINIDLYSDVLGYYESGKNWNKTETVDGITRRTVVDRDILMNNVKERRTVYALTGAGYGPESVVEGDVHLRLMPQATTENATTHPTISTIFGGAHNGKHVGNSTTEIRDGMVFSNLYAGSRAAFKYGSSEVIVGYPKYYICNTSGTYSLDRADKVTAVAKNDQTNHDGTPVIKKTVKYRKGDIVAANVVDQLAVSALRSNFTEMHELPTDFKTSWDNISINIGDNSAMNTPSAKFYGGGGIYGGGHALNESAVTYSGTNTQLAFDDGYGGNSTIIVGDNTAESETKSHISIGTGHYVEVKLDPVKGDKIGKYALKDGKFIHQSSGNPETGVKYYEMEADGGIYGDGRRTYVQGFRAVDIAGYGYADYSPQSAKLINSFQRIDLLSLNDCCLQLQGAKDYATNSIDATVYSIARIGELRMNSTITGNLDPGVGLRSRNYMGFFNNVHYVGAMVSDTDFDSPYRGIDGEIVSGTSYMEKKKAYINAYETAADKTDATVISDFKKRNLATAPNMIGINNGYTLKLTNAYTTNGGTNSGMLKDVPSDNIYYGPIIGVMEVKLLTLAEDEGGGYIYAFNQHEDGTSGKTFLEETGNFVYPSSINETSDNYIVDDCYPEGYYEHESNATNEKAHYWYVQGHHYYFNTTLTAYTYNQNINFKLNNNDELIMLSGITPATSGSINIEDIVWEEHVTDDKCALTNDITDEYGNHTREQYQLYLTIDKNTGNEYDLKKNDEGTAYTNVGNAFVARIPNGNGNGAYGTGDDGKIQFANNYSDKSATDKNSPLLGIRLQDTDKNNFYPDFYKAHLDDDDNLVITIKATDADDGKPNTYTIRLKIVYLQGPYIDGKVTIENCALPGEYIYANTGKVDMEMDDALTVTGKKWYLYPRQKQNENLEIYSWDYDHPVDVSEYLMDNITGDINRLQLPARYYQNDWKLGYSIIVNNQPFPLPEPTGDDAYSNHIAVHNYHRMSTVASEVKKGTTYGYDLDLDLVGGALVYIEDDYDFEIFTKYVNYCNAEGHAVPLPGDNAKGQNGKNVKNPAGAENIRFVLNSDITLSDKCKTITEFRGTLNGNGHVISAGHTFEGDYLIEKNYGKIYYVGVVSEGGTDDKPVFNENYGTIANSFYYYYPTGNPGSEKDYSASSYASLIGSNSGTTVNCYQNTDKPNASSVGATYRPSEAFHYGLVAYNLNQEYLKARQSSKDDDGHVHDNMITDDYLYDYYADGDYRYANVRSDEHPEGLRLTDNFGNPNYENYLGDERTMHETDKDKTHDVRRWFTISESRLVQRDERGNIVYTEDAAGNIKPVMTNEGYFPIYLYDAKNALADHSDFIFFGQRLTPNEKERQYYPHRIKADNRVYRAGGFYGTRVDSAFHFNRDAWAMQKTLTAIDFTGHLDVKGDAGYKTEWQERIADGAAVQYVYYPPVLDLPGGDGKENLHNLTSFDVVSNDNINDYSKITKNLLVYTPETDDDYNGLFSKLHYTRMLKWGEKETNQNDIIGHHIYWISHDSPASSHFHSANGLFHLVDEQDFNAPIAFVVAGDGESTSGTDGRAWMLRKPKGYSSRINTTDANGFSVSKDAWESIALPFTVNRVWAVNSGDYIEKYSRGQITHFYGDNDTHHDYWLRGLTGAALDDCGKSDDVIESATFARPGSAAGLFQVKGEGGKDEQMRGDYEFFNNWFYTSYKDVAYNPNHNEYAEPMLFDNYCYLTKNAPYIIAFPGEDYYEFDLSGKFYNDKHATDGCHKQEILYEFRVEDAKEGKNFDNSTKSVNIPVTDVYDAVRTTTVPHDDGYTTSHCATFKRIAGDEIDDNMYVLNTEPKTIYDVHGQTVDFPAGSIFINCKYFGIEEILPFHTYLSVKSNSSGNTVRPFITIGNGTRGIDSMGGDEEEESEPQNSGVQIFVKGNALVVVSDRAFSLPVYGVAGQLYSNFAVKPGTNVYRGLNSGVYVTQGLKFVIKRM